ncbi:MAG: 4-Cys prefix domain-containing protein, partial [Microcoleus sp.]
MCCLNPDCQYSHNSTNDRFCLKCGSHLLLKQRYRPIELIGEGGFG